VRVYFFAVVHRAGVYQIAVKKQAIRSNTGTKLNGPRNHVQCHCFGYLGQQMSGRWCLLRIHLRHISFSMLLRFRNMINSRLAASMLHNLPQYNTSNTPYRRRKNFDHRAATLFPVSVYSIYKIVP
jgi:hypothetical protein